jgi:Acyl-CoA dehydrogenase, N-terminal domain.
MDFSFTDDQLSIQSIARDFAQKRIAPVAAELDAQGRVSAGEHPRDGQLGLMGIEVPEATAGRAWTDRLRRWR